MTGVLDTITGAGNGDPQQRVLDGRGTKGIGIERALRFMAIFISSRSVNVLGDKMKSFVDRVSHSILPLLVGAAWLATALSGCDKKVARVGSNATGLAVSLEIDSQRISVADPLFAKVRIANTTDHAMTFKKPFSAGFGTIQFEFTDQGEYSERKISAQGAGLDDTLTGSITLAAGESTVSYEVFFWGPRGPVFSEPGRYSLRAFTQTGGTQSFSNIVTVQVQPRDQLEINRIEDSQKLALALITPRGISDRVDVNEINALIVKLEDSNLRKALLRAGIMIQLLKATDEEEQRQAQADLDKLRRESHPIIVEIRALQLASYYMNEHRPLKAEAALRDLQDRSFEGDLIRGEIENQKRGEN